MLDSDIEVDLKYKNNNGNEISPLKPFKSNLSSIIIAYYAFRIFQGSRIVGDNWDAITVEDYNMFRMNEYFISVRSSNNTSTTSTSMNQ
jgi:hypothetical protein